LKVMYEHKTHPMLPWRRFVRRLGVHVGAAMILIGISLVVGTWGYHALGEESWLDAFVNASMLLGGMGQIGNITTTSGRVFSAFFAMYAGLLLIAVTTIMIAPVLHRILHRIHLEEAEVEASPEG